jgi:hypothetical protein
MKENLNLEHRVKFLKTALALSGIAVNEVSSELIIRLYEGILEKGSKFSLEDSVKIETLVKGKYESKEIIAEKRTVKHKTKKK